MQTIVHPTAVVAASARLGPDIVVGPFAVLEEETELGAGCQVRAHAVIKSYTTLGPGNVVHEHAVLGGEPQDLGYRGAVTRLEIGARNVIREGVTIHRASREGQATRVGSDCLLMGYVHVAHDCRLGDRVIMANNAALAGHVEVADSAFLSAGVGVHQYSRIGRLAMIGGHTKLVQDALPFVLTDGDPGRARGLNLVGLRRAGMSIEQIGALKKAFQLLLRSTVALEAALGHMTALGDPLVDELVAFARTSKRGFAHGRPRATERDE